MALIRWTPRTELLDPFAGLAEIQEEMNRLFDTSLHRAGRGEFPSAFLPAVDVVEEKDSYLVNAELPGLAKEDVNVSLQDNCLTIKGEKKYESEKKEAHYYRKERAYGAFSRTIELPSTVDAKKMSNLDENVPFLTTVRMSPG